MRKIKTNNRGAIALVTMVVLGTVIILVAFSIVILGMSSRHNAVQLSESDRVFVKTDGCLEEALLQLSRDNAYAGGSYDVDGADCTVSVSGADNQRTIALNAFEGDFYHHFIVDVQLAPQFGILNFSY